MASLGIVETRSIAQGVLLCDQMVKLAEVDLLRSKTICSGRFLIIISGEQAAVQEAMTIASGKKVRAHHQLSRVSSQVIAVLEQRNIESQPSGALGLVECKNVAAGIAGADKAVKTASVQLVRIVCGQGINGKSYFVICGKLTDVEEGVSTAVTAIGMELLDTVVIPSPESSLVSVFLSGRR